MPKSNRFVLAFLIAYALFGLSLVFATEDTRIVGTVSVKNAVGTTLNLSTTSVKITDGSSIVPVVTGSYGTTKGLRVYIGPTDPISDIPVFIDYDHHQVHEGESFQASYLISSLASGSSADFYINVPTIATSTYLPHLTAEVISTAETELFLYEEATFTSTGTALSAYNRNRDSSRTCLISFGHSATINSTGTQIWTGLTGSNRTAGSDREGSEFILKSNTLYGLRVTSRSAGDKILVRFHLYEDAGT